MAEPLLVRVARREPVERTPVWFMRQAGRSLPEYRALRERHAFFELAGTPELCAEVTLQPVRRHHVDAAVLFADIMTPVLGMGIGVELVEGVGPVVDRPIERMADVERLSVSEPDENVLEAIRSCAASSSGPRGRRLLRRPLHGRRLSRRGEAEPRLRAHEGADVSRAGCLARAHGAARGSSSRATSPRRSRQAQT